ncbi:MAG: ABC transporter ATP-binding protein [Candidatus Glassbacteria bacterium]|nr:ABC transporter ATP-binding protein [Candidatus Glassbacteria bacterium]
MIELTGVTKKYGEFTAVDDISLRVEQGELFGFLGPNGAGKTTTIKMITGLLQPTAGTVRVAGFDLAEQPEEAKRRVGFIPDRPFIYNRLTAVEFLRFMGGLWEMPAAEIAERGGRLLELFDLTGWQDELVESYSHGMRQKLILSGALLHDPDVIVVDEPMVGLDPASIRLVKDIFRELCSRGRSVFMSTHTLAVAEETCSRVAIIQNGRIRAEGTLEELRHLSRKEDSGLEEVFLSLTAGEKIKKIDWWKGR